MLAGVAAGASVTRALCASEAEGMLQDRGRKKFSPAAPATAAPEPLAAFCRAASMHRAKLLPWPSGWQLLALLLCLLQLQHAAAQIGPDSDWMDNSYSTEYRAASVVTNLWIAAFAVTSALFGLLGAAVALQWPNPRVLCYKTSYSDMPSSTVRSCCSLYSLNLGFCVFWLLVFAVMIIARDVVRIVVCLCFCLVHSAVVVVFRMKFKRFGRPERPYGANDLVASRPTPGDSSSMVGAQPQAVGIPIYSIPMRTVVVGDPSDAGSGAPAAQQQAGGSYWAGAECVPPTQHPAIGAAVAPAAGPPGAAAAGAAAGAPVGGSVAMPFAAVGGALPAALSQGSISYPPQPQSSSSPYASPYPAGPAAAAAVAAGAAAPAGYYSPYPQCMGSAAGHVMGVAVPSAAVGGGPAAAAGDAGGAAAAAAGGAAGAAVAAGAGAGGGAGGVYPQQRQSQQ